jgi:hypothetical protein
MNVSSETTHIVMKEFKVTEKAIMSVIEGASIVSPNFFHTLSDALSSADFFEVSDFNQ